ncbi:MAG: haloacid dehalogenase-like hydrolase [Actinobacteria bacterium]|nr:haloacid dehalogenase-like hydrolase [Actinomycetota bacterium]MBI3686704.1 haloacid dehalogenase-like hydrolase [Actinomycetota bacterium]
MVPDPRTHPERIRLVLWDIDHTLIETRGVGRDIYQRIFPTVTGQPLHTLAAVHGRTELDIIHDTLQLHGITPTDETMRALATALADGYTAAIDELATRGRVLPGARAALADLATEPSVHQSVLTGNTTAVAKIKIKTFGLGEHLDLLLGAYGDDHQDRATLVTIARTRATNRLGATIDPTQVVIIGDTPNDMRAATMAGARAIGITTGRYSAGDLRAAGATSTLPSLVDLPRLRHAPTDRGTPRQSR